MNWTAFQRPVPAWTYSSCPISRTTRCWRPSCCTPSSRMLALNWAKRDAAMIIVLWYIVVEAEKKSIKSFSPWEMSMCPVIISMHVIIKHIDSIAVDPLADRCHIIAQHIKRLDFRCSINLMPGSNDHELKKMKQKYCMTLWSLDFFFRWCAQTWRLQKLHCHALKLCWC